jgi:hypothetical protein
VFLLFSRQPGDFIVRGYVGKNAEPLRIEGCDLVTISYICTLFNFLNNVRKVGVLFHSRTCPYGLLTHSIFFRHHHNEKNFSFSATCFDLLNHSQVLFLWFTFMFVHDAISYEALGKTVCHQQQFLCTDLESGCCDLFGGTVSAAP